MPLRHPFSTTGEQIIKNTSSHRIKLITRLFQRFLLIQATALLPNPFGIGYPCPTGSIHRYHAIVGGANGTTMVVMFVRLLCWCLAEFSHYSYSRKATGQEFFVPTQTLIAVKLLTKIVPAQLLLITILHWESSIPSTPLISEYVDRKKSNVFFMLLAANR